MTTPVAVQMGSYTSPKLLRPGIHTLYVQEATSSGAWSNVAVLAQNIMSHDPYMVTNWTFASVDGTYCFLKNGAPLCGAAEPINSWSGVNAFGDSNSIAINGIQPNSNVTYLTYCRLRDNGALDFVGATNYPDMAGRPAPRPGEPNVVDFTCSAEMIAAVLDNGQIWESSEGETPRTLSLPNNEHAVSIGGSAPTCAISTVGNVWCWQPLTVTEIGFSELPTQTAPYTQLAGNGNVVMAMGGGSIDVCGITDSGALRCAKATTNLLPAGRSAISMALSWGGLCALLDNNTVAQLDETGTSAAVISPPIPTGRIVKGVGAMAYPANNAEANTVGCCARLDDDTIVCDGIEG